MDDLDRVRKIMQLIPSDILPDSKKFRRAKQHARFLRQTVKKVMEGHAIMPEEELMISQVCNAVLDSENAGGSLQPFFLELVSNMEFENVPP